MNSSHHLILTQSPVSRGCRLFPYFSKSTAKSHPSPRSHFPLPTAEKPPTTVLYWISLGDLSSQESVQFWLEDSPSLPSFNRSDPPGTNIFQKGGFGDLQVLDRLISGQNDIFFHQRHWVASICFDFRLFEAKYMPRRNWVFFDLITIGFKSVGAVVKEGLDIRHSFGENDKLS